jgi:hypothetical protein
MSDLVQRTAALCREMESGDLQTIVEEIGAGPILQRILDALAPGADTTTLGADLDALDTHLIDYGIAGGLLPPTQRQYQPSPTAAGSHHPAVEVWACPMAQCNRWQPVGSSTEDGPECAVRGVPLIRKLIST